MGSFFDNKPGTSSSTSSSTTTDSHYQQGQYDNLLGAADQWLNQSQGANKPNYLPGMEQALGAMGGQYADVLSGKVDTTALNNALQAQAQQATQAFDRNIMPGISQSANAAGAAGGSRQGIAEGIARGDLASSIATNQANTINQFQQQQVQNQMAAAQGMGNLFDSIGNLQNQAQANTPEAQRLKELLAYQQLISGNMGGTTSSEGTSSGTQTAGSNSTFDKLLGAGTAIGGAWLGKSDKKLKKDVKSKKDKKGKTLRTKDGTRIVEWTWNEEGNKRGLKGRGEGVIAQELAKNKPSAVKRDEDGDLAVDYSQVKRKK